MYKISFGWNFTWITETILATCNLVDLVLPRDDKALYFFHLFQVQNKATGILQNQI